MIDSSSKKNEYQGYLMGPVRTADKLTTFMCRLAIYSGCLNLMEPQGPY